MSTETTNNVESTRIDYLSLLPNELLEDVFDYAYSSSPPPTLPLSKRLLPFHQKHLYRQISLSSSSRVDKFLTSISNRKEIGSLVNSLELERKGGTFVTSFDILEELFPLLPNVQHLGLHSEFLEVGSRSRRLFSSLSSVQSVTTAPRLRLSSLDLGDFDFLAALPNLSKLTINDWPIVQPSQMISNTDNPLLLSHVELLRIEGEGAEDPSVSKLVEVCPRLSKIELTTKYNRSTSFRYILPLLPPTLTSLKLESIYRTAESDDSELLRFTNLRSLGLGPSCYYKDIHSALLQLPLLVDIRLEGGPISPLEFIPLIAGPTRLIHLKSIILDLNVEDRGQQILEPTDVSSDHLRMQDWTLPRASLWQREEDEYLDYQGSKHLIGVAVEAGVKVEGSVREALEAFEDYWIEKSNRAVLLVCSRGFDWIDTLRAVRLEARELGVNLPSLDIDSLDQERLELVKFNQGGRDWKILSLRNREEDPLQE